MDIKAASKRNWKATRIGVVLLALIATVALAGLMATDTAQADGGPHQGTFSTTTDACAACHRLHTGQAPELLRASQTNLCLNCHNGTGSDLNVEDGVYEATGGGLRGGGFINALMDTDMDGIPVSAAVTSAHTIDGSSSTAWGGGAISSTPNYGSTIALECANCHDPHGNSKYRILRKSPKQSGAPSDVALPDETPKVYEISYTLLGYRDVSYASQNGKDFSAWCAQCHTRHLAASGSADTDSGDAVYTYRHLTDGLIDGCINCHVAHGTSATMASNSSAVTYPDGTLDGAQNSRLLHVDNRGVCIQCHQPGGN